MANKVPPDYYDRGVKKNFFQRIWHRPRFKLVQNLIRGTQGKILDIGCADGTLTQKIAEVVDAHDITGIDISRPAIEYARERHPQINFQIGNCYNLPFTEATFDLITFLEVIEHLDNPPRVFQEIKRCLKKGGYLVILVPTESLLFRVIWFFWTKAKGRVWAKAGGHIQKFNGRRLEKLLETQGFKIIQNKKSHLGMLKIIKAQKVNS